MMSERESVFRLMKGQIALVGYGSLMSRSSLERTLGRTYTGPFLQCTVRGWRRTWDAAVPNRKFYAERVEGRITPRAILYLNVTRDPPTTINGVIFVVNQEELAAYDQRESIYERVDVRADLDVEVEGGPIYMYVCRPVFRLPHSRSPADAAVRVTYLRLIEEGLAELDQEFRQQYEESTDIPPAHLIIEDRVESHST